MVHAALLSFALVHGLSVLISLLASFSFTTTVPSLPIRLDIPEDGTTVREWLLSRSPASFDLLDSYRVFCRVLGEVERRHAAGVWGALRPSCIRCAFAALPCACIENTPRLSGHPPTQLPNDSHPQPLPHLLRLTNSGSVVFAPSTPPLRPLPSHAEAEACPPPELSLPSPSVDRPLERWRAWEDRWYVPPLLSSWGRAREGGLPMSGDARDDLFCLGMLLLELLWPFDPALGEVGRAKRLDAAAQRILPVDTLQRHPREVALALSLLHPEPAERPSVRELLGNSVVLSFMASFQDTGRYESELARHEEAAELLLAALQPVLGAVAGEGEGLGREVRLLTAALDSLEARLQAAEGEGGGPSADPPSKRRRTEGEEKKAHDAALAEGMWARMQAHVGAFDALAIQVSSGEE